jgi:hypothetical protein
VLTHPVTALIVGLATSLVFHQLSRQERSPRYAVSASESIASVGVSDPRLVIHWNGTPIHGVRMAKVAFWNGGRAYIEPSDVLVPITVVPSRPVQILDVNVLRTSRDDLRFTARIDQDSARNRPVVRLSVSGTEVLERMDGALVQILYAPPAPTDTAGMDFQVTGRIKGVTGRFHRQPWEEATAGASPIPEIIAILLFAAFWTALVIEAFREWRAGEYGKVTKAAFAVVLIGLLLAGGIREAAARWPKWARTADAQARVP